MPSERLPRSSDDPEKTQPLDSGEQRTSTPHASTPLSSDEHPDILSMAGRAAGGSVSHHTDSTNKPETFSSADQTLPFEEEGTPLFDSEFDPLAEIVEYDFVNDNQTEFDYVSDETLAGFQALAEQLGEDASHLASQYPASFDGRLAREVKDESQQVQCTANEHSHDTPRRPRQQTRWLWQTSCAAALVIALAIFFGSSALNPTLLDDRHSTAEANSIHQALGGNVDAHSHARRSETVFDDRATEESMKRNSANSNPFDSSLAEDLLAEDSLRESSSPRLASAEAIAGLAPDANSATGESRPESENLPHSVRASSTFEGAPTDRMSSDTSLLVHHARADANWEARKFVQNVSLRTRTQLFSQASSVEMEGLIDLIRPQEDRKIRIAF